MIGRRAPLLRLACCAVGLLAGCQRAADSADSAAATVRGPIAFAAVEQGLHARGVSAATPGPAELLASFEEGARLLAVEALLVPADERELERAIAGLGQTAEKIRHRAVVELFRSTRSSALAVPTEAEVAAAFAADPERFHRPAQRFVWHLLLRVEPGADPQPVVEQARALKREIEAGASFSAIAREHSRSETRALGGRLGSIPQGRLPAAVERIVFALGEGEVSEPVRSKDGVLLFQASDIIPEKRFELADVRGLLARELFAERRRQALRELAGQEALPEGSKLLDPEALRRAVALGDAEVVLRVGDLEWTVGELREEIAARRAADPTARSFAEDADLVYGDWVDSERIFVLAGREGFVRTQAAAIAARQRAALAAEITRREVDARIERLAAGRSADLERHYEDNRFLYQTPLRMHLRMLSVPLGDDPGRRLVRLEAAHAELQSGRATLESVARERGGIVQDAGWSSARDLEQFEPKIRYLLVDMTSTGYTVPFQFNQRISIVQVAERVDPVVRPYAEVEADVRRDYVARHRQALYREVQEEVLRSGRFRFHEAAVRLRLGLPARAGAE